MAATGRLGTPQAVQRTGALPWAPGHRLFKVSLAPLSARCVTSTASIFASSLRDARAIAFPDEESEAEGGQQTDPLLSVVSPTWDSGDI